VGAYCRPPPSWGNEQALRRAVLILGRRSNRYRQCHLASSQACRAGSSVAGLSSAFARFTTCVYDWRRIAQINHLAVFVVEDLRFGFGAGPVQEARHGSDE